MRFACVEYTTKTGRIWRPTPARPNYLCDPQKEIDPTSFGCYTSALDGEHIPLTGLIYGSLERPPSVVRRARQDLFRRLRGAFASYSLAHLAPCDALLVIYQTSNNLELIRFLERVRHELPNTLLVSSSSPPFGRLRDHWKDHRDAAERYQIFVGLTHFNMNVCRATVPWYRAFSDTPSLYLPQPYPVEYAAARAVGGGQWAAERRTGGRPVVYVAGDTTRPDIMSGHLIAKTLQQRNPELLIRVTNTPGSALNTSFLRGTDYEVQSFRPWAEQLKELATVRLVINTDLWWTRGRVPVDCAAAGVPCVGTTSDGQSELWPDLTTGGSVEIDRLLTLAERALTDQAFRDSVVARAKARLASYTYPQTIERFQRALTLATRGRLDQWQDPVWEGDQLRFPAERAA